MKYTRVYHENLKAYLSRARLIINQGGQGSGKTFSILQVISHIALLSNKPLYIIIASYALPHLKGGAMMAFDSILEAENVNIGEVKNKSEHTYYINKAKIEFFGIEGNEARAHSLRPDILFVNEANRRISWNVFLQFYSRVQRATFLDFNPSAEFWLNEHILGKENDYVVIRSNYMDNPFIVENERRFIESKKDKPEWASWYKVYGLGEWGQLEDAILPYDVGQFDNSLPFVFGLDFGIRDPDACVKVAVDKKRNIIYVKEMLYESGNSTDELYRKLLLTTGAKNLIVADSASPRTIIDLRRLGLNIIPAIKNRKNETIKKIKEYKIIVDDSYNLMRELNGWTWLDKKAEIPMDGNDHLIDALLYAASYLIEGRKGVAVV